MSVSLSTPTGFFPSPVTRSPLWPLVRMMWRAWPNPLFTSTDRAAVVIKSPDFPLPILDHDPHSPVLSRREPLGTLFHDLQRLLDRRILGNHGIFYYWNHDILHMLLFHIHPPQSECLLFT